jgi:hypothetical protein
MASKRKLFVTVLWRGRRYDARRLDDAVWEFHRLNTNGTFDQRCRSFRTLMPKDAEEMEEV